MAKDTSGARWREWLTPKERVRVAKIEAAEAKTRELTAEKHAIANRALQRAKYADRQEAKRREKSKP